MKIRWTKQAEGEETEVFLEKGTAMPETFQKLGKKRGGDCRISVKKEGFSEEEWTKMLCNGVCSLYDGAYRFSKSGLKSLGKQSVYENRDSLSDYGDNCYTFVLEGTEQEIAALERGEALGRCKGYARTLGNLPNNYLHTEDMASYAGTLAKELKISCETYGDQKLEELGCGGLLAVNQGSRREAAMVVLRYEGAPGTDWTALVGKGLMFDAGGYHLKSIDGMKGMKYDMCGAAEMLEMMEYLVTRKVRKNVMAVLMLAENVINSDAVKMGDVITTLAGKTVEVYNTDAEGRLVLCDGITFAQRMGARTVIDLATLTYSAQSALGDQVVALFGNDREALRTWKETAEVTGEHFWQLPMGPIYHKMIEWSICADFANYAPGRGAGASVAACFLENFVEEGTRWIHLDMVGPSVVRKETDEMAEGASGACMSTLAAYLTR